MAATGQFLIPARANPAHANIRRFGRLLQVAPTSPFLVTQAARPESSRQSSPLDE